MRHNLRHKVGVDMKWFHRRLRIWGIERNDPDARDVERRLMRIWPRLRLVDQLQLLEYVELYAKACLAETLRGETTREDREHALEGGRRGRKPDPLRQTRITDLVLAVGRAVQFCEWVTADPKCPDAVRDLLTSKAWSAKLYRFFRELISAAARSTPQVLSASRRHWAREMCGVLKWRTGKLHQELVMELVYLASGRQVSRTDRTLRRDLGGM